MYQGKFSNQSAGSTPKRRPRKKSAARVRRGTMMFYTIYAASILLFLIAMIFVMNPLRDWLINYEASQPSHKKNEVFQQLFVNKNWEEVYTLANVEGSNFDNKSTYAAYMNKLVGNQELTCLETSAGLSGDKKFVVKLGDQKIASFTLTGGSKSETEIPNWELGKVELFLTGNHSVTVEKYPDQTAYINGIALDDSYTIRNVSTVAEDYLPEGIHGYRIVQQQVTGLLAIPEVTIKNADGTAVVVGMDTATGIYRQNYPQQVASTEEKAAALSAAQAYGKYMIKNISRTELGKYFDTSSKIYDSIIRSEVNWMQSYRTFDFSDASYSHYYRYSDTLFSIRVDVTLNVYRSNGTVKEYDLSNTVFLTKKANGWIATDMTNLDVQNTREEVRLVFVDGDTVLSDTMIAANSKSLTLPSVAAPEGKVLKAWATKVTDENGNITMTPVYTPNDKNEIYLPSGTVLTPTTLYALYDEAGEA